MIDPKEIKEIEDMTGAKILIIKGSPYDIDSFDTYGFALKDSEDKVVLITCKPSGVLSVKMYDGNKEIKTLYER